MLWPVSLNSLCNEFQSRTEYRERPKATRVQTATTSWWPAAEHRWRLCAISETGTQSTARYQCTVPMRQRWVKMMTLHDALRHESSTSSVCHASAVSSRGQTIVVPVITRAAAVLHSSHVAVCWWWLLEPRRERRYNSPPMTLQRRGHVSPQTPRWASAEYVRANEGRERGRVLGEDGDSSKVLVQSELHYSRVTNQVCTKVTLCLQLFTTLNKNPGQKSRVSLTALTRPGPKSLTRRPGSISGTVVQSIKQLQQGSHQANKKIKFLTFQARFLKFQTVIALPSPFNTSTHISSFRHNHYLQTAVFKYVTVFLFSCCSYYQLEMQTAFDCKKIPCQTAKFPDIPVKTEFPDSPWFSRKWEPCGVVNNHHLTITA